MKEKLLSLILVCNFVILYSQTENTSVNSPSPNAATLGLFGSVPVSHFTGTPNINIPLHTISEKDIAIPLTLSYHLSAVKPDAHPGWVGLGWSLSAGGSITREVKGIPDEYKRKNDLDNGINRGFYFLEGQNNMNDLDSDNWYLQLGSYGNNSSYHQRDVMSDNFHFNFLGYSGSFYLNEKNEWKVNSDQNIKVLFDPENGGLVTQDQLRNPLKRNNKSFYNDNYFTEFTIVTDDGTKYKFGGVEATEYSLVYTLDHQNVDSKLIPTTWNLIEIEKLNGDKVEFEYESEYGGEHEIICTRFNNISYNNYQASGCASYNSDIDKVGDLIFPVYLKKITSNTTIIEFERSNSKELRYSSFDFSDTIDSDNVDEEGSPYYDSYNDLQWKQLDVIQIRNSTNDLIKSFHFDYTNDNNTRLKLLELRESFPQGNTDIIHSFNYNSTSLPVYCSTGIDHWGFYNGFNGTIDASTYEEFFAQYHTTRAPATNVDYYKAETLEKIIYPTGGYTLFEYEQNDYRQVVSENRSILETKSSNTKSGGLRIKKIESYTSDEDSNPITKEYFYVKGYLGENNPSTLSSSGVQNSKHQYYWDTYLIEHQGIQFYFKKGSTVSMLPGSFNSLGSPVSYSEVVEKSNQNGYTIFEFTNYDNGYKDELPIATRNFQQTPYRQFTNTSKERGKPLSIKKVNNDNKTVEIQNFNYERSSSDYVRSVDVSAIPICTVEGNTLSDYVGVAYKRYIYDFNLIEKETITYDEKGENERANIVEYTYNDEKLLSETKTWDSFNRELVTTYEYPSDYPTGNEMSTSLYQDMIDVHFLNPVIKTQTKIDSDIISTSATRYSSQYFPFLMYSSKADDPLERREFIFTYDTTGNIINKTKIGSGHTSTSGNASVSYIWGYNKSLPIAKIEGMTRVNLEDFFEHEIYIGDILYGKDVSISYYETLSNNDVNKTSENILIAEFKELRDALNEKLKRVFITTYTYDPLIGMTSVTDPRGKTVYYEYDDLNRLEYVKDDEGNLLSANEYNYKN
ncbi:RHS repeat domain-containing protein [Aquimarina pacifica]|uniref:RHS repeat protein n=1 Tax=Aquimarina pacifica TaxID=1296415 RepID=UPI0004701EF1|nr:RHS repeat protein [Aquimarina pacifica]